MINSTPLALSGVSLVRRRIADDDQQLFEAAWIGELSPRAAMHPQFRYQTDFASRSGNVWGERRPEENPTSDQALDLQSLVSLAEDREDLEPGEVRLVGWSLDEIPGLNIEPSGTRRRHATLIVAHLARSPGSTPRPDVYKLESDQTLPTAEGLNGAPLPGDDEPGPPEMDPESPGNGPPAGSPPPRSTP